MATSSHALVHGAGPIPPEFDDTRLADAVRGDSNRRCRIPSVADVQSMFTARLFSYLAFSENCVCRTTLTLISPG
jgi:hypothetical protein